MAPTKKKLHTSHRKEKSAKSQLVISPLFRLSNQQIQQLVQCCNNNNATTIRDGHRLDNPTIAKIIKKKIPNLVAAAAILQNKQVIGYVEITKQIMKGMVKTSRSYPFRLNMYVQTTSIIPVINPKLIAFLSANRINKLAIWMPIPATMMDAIPLLVNSGWMFGKKDGAFNIYIIDYRIGEHKILAPSREKSKYDRKFIMSVKTVNPDLNNEILQMHLENSGLVRTTDPKSRPLILYTEGLENSMVSKAYYYTECYIMNMLSKAAQVITNKYWLYLNFNRMFPDKCRQYMAATMDIMELDPELVTKKHQVFIARPVGHLAWSGQGIVVVHDKESLDKAISNIGKYENIIASEYILNPFLYQGKKTHLRCFLLASIIDGVFTTWLFDFYRLYHAKLPFIHSDWENKEIHDTHLKSTSRNIYGPDDLDADIQPKFRSVVWDKMCDCMRHVSMILEGHAIPYSNAANAFEIFGCDIMVRDNYDIVLMEVNEHTGLDLKPEPEKIKEFSQKYFGCINDMIINPIVNGIQSSAQPLYQKRLNGNSH